MEELLKWAPAFSGIFALIIVVVQNRENNKVLRETIEDMKKDFKELLTKHDNQIMELRMGLNGHEHRIHQVEKRR